MKFYEKKENLWLGLFFVIVGICVGSIYWSRLVVQTNNEYKGILVKAEVIEINFRGEGGSYGYTAKVLYNHPTTNETTIGYLGGYESSIDIGDVIEAYYNPGEDLLIYKDAKVHIINQYLLYALIFEGIGLGLIGWCIHRRIQAKWLMKNGQKLIGEIAEFDPNKNIITCQYKEDKKEWYFHRKHVDINKLEKGISLGQKVHIYVKDTNYKIYHIAIEETNNIGVISD